MNVLCLLISIYFFFLNHSGDTWQGHFFQSNFLMLEPIIGSLNEPFETCYIFRNLILIDFVFLSAAVLDFDLIFKSLN